MVTEMNCDTLRALGQVRSGTNPCSCSRWLQPTEYRIDQRVDKGVRYDAIFVGYKQPVVEGPIESIQDNVGIQARAEFTTLHGSPNNLAGDVSTWLNPTCPNSLGDRARDGKQWEKQLDTFPLCLFEVRTAELSRVGRPFHHPIAMGARLLRAAVSPGQEAPRRGSCISLQMDSHYLSLLEGAGGVMAAIALLVFHSNYMVAPLIPAFLREFAVLPDALDWLVAFSLHNSAKSGNQIPRQASRDGLSPPK
jgi:hypothetical protein